MSNTSTPSQALPAREQRLSRSVRLRLTIACTLLVFVAGVLLLAVTYVLVERATGSNLSYSSPSGQFSISLHKATTAPDTRLYVRDNSGTSSNGSGGLPPDEKAVRALAIKQHENSMHELLLQGGLALAIVMVASAGLGWYAAGRMLKPLRTITSTVRDITATNLHRRLALKGPRDELTELGDTFDGLLGRLEASFEAQRQFVANASHELRTPLARQRAIGQVALDDPDATTEELRRAHERILAAGREQEEMIEALLALARGQSDLSRRTPVDLSLLVQRSLADRAGTIEAKSLQVESVTGKAPAVGEPKLLERLVGNVIENAVKYTPDRGSIEVTTSWDGRASTVVVSNSGPAVTAEEISAYLEPFRRGVPDRTGQGLGLGLPIVAAIARAHLGQLQLRPRPGGGLVAQIALPAGQGN